MQATVPPPQTPALGIGDVLVTAVRQETEGALRRLRGAASIETTTMRLRADEVDYNEQTGEAEARGNVRFENFLGGERLEAERVEYNVVTETGRFYEVKGSTPAKVEARPGVLTTTSPFSFQGRWAERLKDRYVLHDGFITNCRLPKPWWIIRGPTFDVVPGQRAVARNSVFRLKGVPLFYTPYFYKSLEQLPRRSGFLTPNFGNSNRRGQMLGGGYYWAINRSYDLLYRGQYFTTRGLAHNVDLRGKPSARSDFNMVLFGVNDRGLPLDDGTRLKQGGFQMTFTGRADLGDGWQARGLVNYLSRFTFRQAFTESFNEAIFSEVNSIGFLTKHWGTNGVNLVLQRSENYQSSTDGDRIVIRRLPQFEYLSRDHALTRRGLPLYVSLETTAGAVRRNQLQFQTRQFVERIDVAPRVSTAFRWREFHLTPYLQPRSTYYGSTLQGARVVGDGVWRNAPEVGAELRLPTLARVFDAPWRWRGQRWKHAIEPAVLFRAVRGVNDFQRFIRFDETELLSNTTEAELSITNRLYSRRQNGAVEEVLAWQVSQRRFFDPTFGGAVLPGRRNVVLSSVQMTGFTFFDQPRNYSPIVSVLRALPDPRLGIEWRSDYDPLRGKMVNSSLTVDGRFSSYFLSLGHTQVGSVPFLSPSANQLRALVGFGQENQRGWNAAFSAIYDVRDRLLQFSTTQVTYNSDCCGLSVQFRRFNFGARQENQVRVAFVVANLGSFGTLRRQERIF